MTTSSQFPKMLENSNATILVFFTPFACFRLADKSLLSRRVHSCKLYGFSMARRQITRLTSPQEQSFRYGFDFGFQFVPHALKSVHTKLAQ